MKIDFTKIKLFDIDGKPIISTPPIHKTIADVIYKFTEKLDLVDLALQINRGEEVNVQNGDVKEIKRIINSRNACFFAFAKKAILDTIEEREKAEKANKKED